jgi:hypothetical protein
MRWFLFATFFALVVPIRSQVFYDNDFETGNVAGWSTTVVDPNFQRDVGVGVNPPGDRSFLGDFGGQLVRFDSTGLPLHDSLILELDLYVIRTWDGNAAGDGPDLFMINDSERGDLLRTTFTNNTAYRQAYPDAHPGGDNPALTGASAVSSLGYAEGDAVYRLRFAYPHTGARVALTFSAELRDIFPEITNESWAIDNMRITTVAALPSAATIVAGVATGAPGETVIIPIYLRDVVSIGSSRATAIRTRLRFNASMLMPETPTPKGTVVGNERIIDLEMPVAIGSDSTIARLHFRVVVGDDTATALTLETTTGVGGDIAFIERAGTFRVRGLCEDGGIRLVKTQTGMLLRRPAPNPARDVATIEYALDSERHVRMELLNATGVVVMQVLDDVVSAGAGSASIDVGELPPGRYLLRMRSGREVREQPVVVIH